MGTEVFMATLIFPKIARTTEEIQTELIGMEVTVTNRSRHSNYTFGHKSIIWAQTFILKYHSVTRLRFYLSL